LVVATVLAVTAAFWLARFPISRADHEERIAARLQAIRAAP
jgi:GPH family glycoside/pentoside/hexuronide:cation symporter